MRKNTKCYRCEKRVREIRELNNTILCPECYKELT